MLYQVRASRVMLALVLGVTAVAGCGSNSQGGNTGAGDKGGSIVALEVLKVDEIQSLIASHKDKKVVVVDYWSTSCEPCMKEFPGLVKLSEKHPDDVACVSVSLDFEGGKNKTPEMVADKVQKFLVSQKATKVKNILSGTQSEDVMAAPALGLDNGAPPLVLVYARDGSLAKKFDNSGSEHFTYADIEKLVAELLAKK